MSDAKKQKKGLCLRGAGSKSPAGVRQYKIFPYYGTKAKAASLVWSLCPDSVDHLIEPFCGSLAVSLEAPGQVTKFLVNDYNALIVNFWRAVQASPDAVLAMARRPCSDLDMWAAEFTTKEWAKVQLPRMAADLDYFDVRMAGLWLYGQVNYLANNFGTLSGPWHRVPDAEGVLSMANVPELKTDKGIRASVPGLCMDMGIRANVPELHTDMGIRAMVPDLLMDKGIRSNVPELHTDKGIRSNVPDLKGDAGEDPWAPVMRRISKKLETYRILCGDWGRVLSAGLINACEKKKRKTMVFLDPPYDDTLSSGGGTKYVCVEQLAISAKVREWCAAQTATPSNLVIMLCGRKTEHDALLDIPGWKKHVWSSGSGYGVNGDHKTEAIWAYGAKAAGL